MKRRKFLKLLGLSVFTPKILVGGATPPQLAQQTFDPLAGIGAVTLSPYRVRDDVILAGLDGP